MESPPSLDSIKPAWSFALLFIKDLQFALCTDLDWKLLHRIWHTLENSWHVMFKCRVIMDGCHSVSLAENMWHFNIFGHIWKAAFMGLMFMADGIWTFFLLMSTPGCAPSLEQMQPITAPIPDPVFDAEGWQSKFLTRRENDSKISDFVSQTVFSIGMWSTFFPPDNQARSPSLTPPKRLHTWWKCGLK